MQHWLPNLISFLLGALGGGTIGSLITIKVVRSQSNRPVQQSNIRAGRDNIGGDKISN